MTLSDFYSQLALPIDPWITNNEIPRTDSTPEGMPVTVAMLSERLHSLRTPSYVSRR
jgi:hypothetical protein